MLPQDSYYVKTCQSTLVRIREVSQTFAVEEFYARNSAGNPYITGAGSLYPVPMLRSTTRSGPRFLASPE